METESRYNPETRWGEKHSPNQDNTPLEEAVFFTSLRQQGATAEQLGFQLKNGSFHSLPYYEIGEIYFEPSAGIVLFFRMGLVRIEGRNLKKLYQQLHARKVVEIREFSENAGMFFATDALFISSITYESENLRRLGI